MTSNSYRQEAFSRCAGVPPHIISINRVDSQDSGYLTDLARQVGLSEPQTVQSPQFAVHRNPPNDITPDSSSPSNKKSKRSASSPSGHFTSSPRHSRKNKTHRCTMCTTDQRFSTKNDLERHLKTRHGQLRKGDKMWICPSSDCSTPSKLWPRFDNFVQHVVKQHGEWDRLKLVESYQIVTEGQAGRNPSWSPKSELARSKVKSMSSSSWSKIDPQLLDARSETYSMRNPTPTIRSTPSIIITRHSSTASTKSATRREQSYVYRPSPRSSGRTIQNGVVSFGSQSPVSPTSHRKLSSPHSAQIASPSCHVSSPKYQMDGLAFDFTPKHDQYSHQSANDATAGDSQDSFLPYFDAYFGDAASGPPAELAGVGSFNDQPPSLSNTSSTLTSGEDLDGLQESMQSFKIPTVDFQVVPDDHQPITPHRRDPLPRLTVTPPYTSANQFQSSHSLPCCSEPLNTPARLLPRHQPITFSPETMLTSLSDGEKSFIYWDVTHDVETNLDPVTNTFIEALVSAILHLYLQQTLTCFHITTRPNHGGEQANRAPRQRRQSTNGGRGLKRKASPPPDGSDPNEDDEDEDEQDGQTPGGSNNHKRVRRSKLLACPYHKNDPLNHRQCSRVILKSNSVVKQHLFRVHRRPEHYCERCSQKFDSSEALGEHIRQEIRCELRPRQFEHLMTYKTEKLIQRRHYGDESDTWYDIYEILFPGARRPDSPYLDDQISVAHLINIIRAMGHQAVHLLMQGNVDIPPASQHVFDQVVSRFSEEFPRSEVNATMQLPYTPETLSLHATHTTGPSQQQIYENGLLPSQMPQIPQVHTPQVNYAQPSYMMPQQGQQPFRYQPQMYVQQRVPQQQQQGPRQGREQAQGQGQAQRQEVPEVPNFENSQVDPNANMNEWQQFFDFGRSMSGFDDQFGYPGPEMER